MVSPTSTCPKKVDTSLVCLEVTDGVAAALDDAPRLGVCGDVDIDCALTLVREVDGGGVPTADCWEEKECPREEGVRDLKGTLFLVLDAFGDIGKVELELI